MKQRILDTLKMMGICFAVIVFFAFLAHGCDDDENESIRREEMREEIWDEAYNEGFGDGVAESQAGNAFIVDENYLKIYDEGYYEGKAYYKEHLDSFLHEIELEDLIDCLWGDYGYDFIEFFNDYTGCNFVDLSADGDG